MLPIFAQVYGKRRQYPTKEHLMASSAVNIGRISMASREPWISKPRGSASPRAMSSVYADVKQKKCSGWALSKQYNRIKYGKGTKFATYGSPLPLKSHVLRQANLDILGKIKKLETRRAPALNERADIVGNQPRPYCWPKCKDWPYQDAAGRVFGIKKVLTCSPPQYIMLNGSIVLGQMPFLRRDGVTTSADSKDLRDLEDEQLEEHKSRIELLEAKQFVGEVGRGPLQ